MTPRRAILRAVVACVVVAAPAAAQPSAADKAQADALFRDGRALMNDGKLALACGKFAESQRLDPAPGTLVNLALCHEGDGKTASAWAEFNEVIERPGDDPARVPFARTHAQALEKQLSRVRIEVDRPAPDEVVAIDGRPHGRDAWGSALPVDPGDHVVEVSAPRKAAWRRVVTVGRGPLTIDVRVPALDDAPAASAPPAPAARETPAAPLRRASPASSGRRTIGIVTGAVGIAAIGVGTYFGLRTLSKKSDADALCPTNRCAGDPRVAPLDDAARSSALASTIALGAGAVAVAAGVYIVLSAPSGESTARITIAPAIARDGGGASLGGRF